MGQRWCARGRLVAIAVVTTSVLAGCTSTADISGTTLAPLSSAAGSQGSAADTAPTVDASPAASTTIESTTAESTMGSENPTTILSPEQQALVERSVALLNTTWAVKDKVLADPSRDWTTEIRNVMGDPAALQELSSAQTLAAMKLHGIGFTTVEAKVESISGNGEPGSTVVLNTCVDSSNGDLVDSDGNSVQAPIEGGPRFRQLATVTVYPGDVLLVSDFVLPESSPSC